MSNFAKKLALMLVLAIVMFTNSGCFMRKLDNTEVGLITNRLTGKSQMLLRSGAIYWVIPWVHEWHKPFDKNVYNLQMTLDSATGDVKGRDDIVYKSIEGNDISADLTITYCIIPDMVEHIITNVAINNDMLKDKIMRAISRSVPRDVFGLLTTEQFCDTQQREQALRQAADALNKVLNPLGVNVITVQNTQYRLENKDYAQAIQNKKIFDQQAEEYAAAYLAQVEKNKALIADAQAEVNESNAQKDGEYEEAVLAADADFNKKDKQAKGIEAVGLAEAEGTIKEREAMATQGGQTQIKQKIVAALVNRGPGDPQLRVMVLPKGSQSGSSGIDIRNTDVNRLIETMGIQSLAGMPDAQEQQQPAARK